MPAANETINEKIILGQDGLAITENYLEHRYNFVCEKSPAVYPNKWATMMEETTPLNTTDLTTGKSVPSVPVPSVPVPSAPVPSVKRGAFVQCAP